MKYSLTITTLLVSFLLLQRVYCLGNEAVKTNPLYYSNSDVSEFKSDSNFDMSELSTEEEAIFEFTFYFKTSNVDFDVNYMTNLESLKELDALFESAKLDSSINKIDIQTSASPDGKYSYNIYLAQKRATSVKTVLAARYPALDESVIQINAYVLSWSELADIIESDLNLPNKILTLQTLKLDQDSGVVERKLKQINGGLSWRYILNNYSSYLRGSTISIHMPAKFLQKQPVVDTLDIAATLVDIDTQVAVSAADSLAVTPLYTPLIPLEPSLSVDSEGDSLSVVSVNSDGKAKKIRKPRTPRVRSNSLFAFKTNYLFNALTLVNLEVEVPIGNRWSVSGEWVFPWWTFDNGTPQSGRDRLQVSSINLEGRYWFGNRTTRPIMTGLFGGVYVGGGVFDVESNALGYQGEVPVIVGISGGYAHTINKRGSLRMEYSIGVGYVYGDFIKYKTHFVPDEGWRPVRHDKGSFSWLGPTKAKISLVWMLNRKRK